MNFNEANCYKNYRKIEFNSYNQRPMINNKFASNKNLDLFSRHYLRNKKFNKIQLRKHEIDNNNKIKNRHGIISFNKISPVNFSNKLLIKNEKNIEENKKN